MMHEERISPPSSTGVSKPAKTEEEAAPCTRMSGSEKGKLKKKLVIDRMLSVPEHRKPFPMVEESFLARIHDPAEREKYMGWAEVYYKSQEQIKREQQYAREELDTLGYVEREVEVTDDEDDAGDN